MKSWKTTLFGIIAGALTAAAQSPGIDPQWAHIMTTIAGILGSLGLCFAKDFNVSTPGQQPTIVEVQGATVQPAQPIQPVK